MDEIVIYLIALEMKEITPAIKDLRERAITTLARHGYSYLESCRAVDEIILTLIKKGLDK